VSGPAKLRAGRRSVAISHPDKVLFAAAGIDKLDLARYYAGAAAWMEPYLKDRPIHLRRFPDGIDGEGFVQKTVPDHYPEWIETVELAKREGGSITQIVSPGAAALAFLAGQNAISIHGWLSRADRPDRPDQLIVDLDPTGDDFGEVREAAAIVREVFEAIGLAAFLKTTGSRGLHVQAPLDRSADFDEVRDLAGRIAAVCAARAPDRLTVEVRKSKRRGRLFVDWLRNGYAQTAVLPYSVRARPEAPIATPIAWEKLASTGPREFTVANAAERLGDRPDPWRGMRRRARGIAAVADRLTRLEG
jgi:bifunctional non-homologous end joining protein LigD